MKRFTCDARPAWQQLCEREGYRWHTEPSGPCWREGAAYELNIAEVTRLQETANQVYALLLEAAARVVRDHEWQRAGIMAEHVPVLRQSYERGEQPLCGRFDFLMDDSGQPKLLEFNADGALTMLETAIIQRDWQQQVMPGAEQFNQLHESLKRAWQVSGLTKVHCVWRPRHPEIEGTVRYMTRVIREAGLTASMQALHSLGWDRERSCFIDMDGDKVDACYKLYPWAWMLRETFIDHVSHASCLFFEPAWSHLLTSKAMLALLWQWFPDHPALLPCYHDTSKLTGTVVTKPIFGREGHNITIRDGARLISQTSGDFAEAPCIHQQFIASPRFNGFLPQFGLWMVHGEAAALGIRESQADIIDQDSAFVPHFIIP